MMAGHGTNSKEPSRGASRQLRPSRAARTIWILVAVGLIGILAFIPTAILTDRSSFCVTCHDMRPFYEAWAQGPHGETACVECHVEPGVQNRLLHKFVALGEVYAELFTSPTFPQYSASIPDARCLRCHAGLETKKVGRFDHRQHRSRGVACSTCHASTGHKVTFLALSDAGVLNESNAPSDMTYVGQQFQRTGTEKASVLAGHEPVACSNCHDQANLECSFCHTPPAKHFGTTCRQCHKPDVDFKDTVFRHPSAGEHNYRSRPCAKCHPDGTAKVYCTCHKGNPPEDD